MSNVRHLIGQTINRAMHLALRHYYDAIRFQLRKNPRGFFIGQPANHHAGRYQARAGHRVRPPRDALKHHARLRTAHYQSADKNQTLIAHDTTSLKT